MSNVLLRQYVWRKCVLPGRVGYTAVGTMAKLSAVFSKGAITIEIVFCLGPCGTSSEEGLVTNYKHALTFSQSISGFNGLNFCDLLHCGNSLWKVGFRNAIVRLNFF